MKLIAILGGVCLLATSPALAQRPCVQVTQSKIKIMLSEAAPVKKGDVEVLEVAPPFSQRNSRGEIVCWVDVMLSTGPVTYRVWVEDFNGSEIVRLDAR